MIVRQRLCALGNRQQAHEMFKAIRGEKGGPNELFDLNKVVPMPRVIRALQKLSSPEMMAAARATPEALTRHIERVQIATSRAWLAEGYESVEDWQTDFWGSTRNVWGVEFHENARVGEPDMRLYFYATKPIFPVVRELSSRYREMLFELTFSCDANEEIGVAHYADRRGLCKQADWRSERGDQLTGRLWEHDEATEVVEEGVLVN